MKLIRVLDSTGDTAIEFDEANAEATAKAKAVFDDWMAEKHPDCADRCQLREHKGYRDCAETGQCAYADTVASGRGTACEEPMSDVYLIDGKPHRICDCARMSATCPRGVKRPLHTSGFGQCLVPVSDALIALQSAIPAIDPEFMEQLTSPHNPSGTAKVPKERHIPAPLSECLMTLRALHFESLSPAERRELEEAAALLELAYQALRELVNRIERCGASVELTHAVTLAADMQQAVGNRWNPRDKYAEARVRHSLATTPS